MTADRWEDSIRTLLRYKQIEKPVRASDVFTTEFMEAVRETR
jgi:hypothetical protein